MKQKFRILDAELIELLRTDHQERKNWLFLESHPDFQGQWRVDGFSQSYFFDLRDTIGPHKVVGPQNLEEFMDVAHALGYDIAFMQDPTKILEAWDHLDDPPEVELNSKLPGTVKGFLPFQARGFNLLKDLDGGVAVWSTGTGKTVLASALIKYALESTDHQPNLVVVVVKAHNKVNTKRALKRLVGLESTVIRGDKKRRRNLYAEAYSLIDDGSGHVPILITNYEKFRTDKGDFKALFEKQNVLVIWDEMPARLKTRTSQVYKAVCECLYRTAPPAVDWFRKRPKKIRQFMLSATPIENDPEDWFNCIRLIDPRIYGTVTEFRDEYVASYSYFNEHKPDRWHKLDRMGLKAAHIFHKADKINDPEIAAQFPEAIPETYYVEWDDKDRRIYDLVTKQAAKLDLEEANVLALIGVMQMLCDAPSLVTNSAAQREIFEGIREAWLEAGANPKTEPPAFGSSIAKQIIEVLGKENLTDERHTKLKVLYELLREDHPNEKVLLFAALNESIMPVLEQALQDWNVKYVRYAGTDKQKQAAEDAFKNDPAIQVFLSSDMGSDSLNLQEASVVIHYDLPWKWSTYTQRENRAHRVDSTFKTVRYYTLLMEDSVEDRKIEIIQKKLGYHDQIFNSEMADKAIGAGMTREDLLYVLTGQRD
jgi:SNF2 family DNA or RNA helicase